MAFSGDISERRVLPPSPTGRYTGSGWRVPQGFAVAASRSPVRPITELSPAHSSRTLSRRDHIRPLGSCSRRCTEPAASADGLRRPASPECWVKVAGTSSSSAEVLCPVRPTGLMGGVTSWPGLVHLRQARMHWRWTCHCQHHAVPRCWQCQIGRYHCSPTLPSYGCRLQRRTGHTLGCASMKSAVVAMRPGRETVPLRLRNLPSSP